MGKEYNTIIHPYSAGLLILIDNVFFGANTLTLGLSTPIMAVLAFSVTGTGVFLVQKFLAGESAGESAARAFFIGVLAGIPTSILGTSVGLLVLAKAGLSSIFAKKKISHNMKSKNPRIAEHIGKNYNENNSGRTDGSGTNMQILIGTAIIILLIVIIIMNYYN